MSDGKARAKLAMERGPITRLELTDEDLRSLTVPQTMSTHKKAAFLRAFARRGIVLDGIEAAGISRGLIPTWRKDDEWFDELFEAAKQEAADRIEVEAYRRAVEGVDEMVIFQGYPTMLENADTGEKRTLTQKRYSDKLLELLMKGSNPEKYRENVRNTHNFEGQTGVLVVPGAIDPDAWAKAAAEQQAKHAGNTGEEKKK